MHVDQAVLLESADPRHEETDDEQDERSAPNGRQPEKRQETSGAQLIGVIHANGRLRDDHGARVRREREAFLGDRLFERNVGDEDLEAVGRCREGQGKMNRRPGRVQRLAFYQPDTNDREGEYETPSEEGEEAEVALWHADLAFPRLGGRLDRDPSK